jgi:hypothetical protein
MVRIEFDSAKFLPFLPEESQANPGAYGFELALWLAQQLMQAGMTTSYPIGEDWGWLIEHIEGEGEFMIGCGSQAEEGEGYKGKPIAWYIFVKQNLSLKQRFHTGAQPEMFERLLRSIQAALLAAGIEAHVKR